jgi:uncharacterized protein YdaT
MPWSTKDVPEKTKKAKTDKQKRQWVHVANGELKRGASEGAAIRAANGVIKDPKTRAGGSSSKKGKK